MMFNAKQAGYFEWVDATELSFRIGAARGGLGAAEVSTAVIAATALRQVSGERAEQALSDIAQGDLSTNIVVAEGDLIVVPPTVLARIGYAKAVPPAPRWGLETRMRSA